MDPKYLLSDNQSIFTKYFELRERIKGLSKKEREDSLDYSNFLDLSSTIRNLVLTGDELIDILERPNDYFQELKTTKKKLDIYKRTLKELKPRTRDYQKELEYHIFWANRANDLEEKLSIAKKMFQGKEGDFVEELRRVLG